MSLTRSSFLVFILLGVLTCGVTLTGCSARPAMTPQEEQANRERGGIERPARALSEEDSFSDQLGKIGVVILVVGITLAGIIVPIILLN